MKHNKKVTGEIVDLGAACHSISTKIRDEGLSNTSCSEPVGFQISYQTFGSEAELSSIKTGVIQKKR